MKKQGLEISGETAEEIAAEAESTGKKRGFGIVSVIGCIIVLLLFVCFDGVFTVSNGSSVTNSSSVTSGSLVINEVVTSNKSCLKDDLYGSPDWIELYNTTNADIDLENFALSNNVDSPAKYLFPKATIPAGGYLVVYAAKKVEGAPDDILQTGFKLSSKGLTLWLTSASGGTLQKLDIPALHPDISYARDENGTYQLNEHPTPGKANADSFISDKTMTAMPDSAPLKITELLIRNTYSIMDSQGERSPWVEVTNTSNEPVQLSNYRLSDSKENYTKWAFPEIELAPGEAKVVFCSGKGTAIENGELHTGFKLGSNDTCICLTDIIAMQQQTIDLPSALKDKDNVSYGLQDGRWLYFSQPTPGMPNTSKGFETVSDVKALDLAGIWINEACAVQTRGPSKTDWIEIANGGSGNVNLQGYYLSDDTDNFKKYQIGDVPVAAGGYKVIYASGTKSEQKEGVAPFGIPGSGDTLVLSSPQGFPIDVFNTGVQRVGITSGRKSGDDSGEKVLFSTPTPGEANGTPAGISYTAQPVFSVPGGYQSGTVSVSMTCQTAGAAIYYTLDGSVPTQSSTLYTEPISVSSNQMVRAIAYSPNLLESDVQTCTYLFDKKHTIPVVCLTMSPSEFKTMYANTDRLTTIERPGFVEYYDTDGQLGISFPCAVRVQGWSGRELFAQKALCFKLSGEYGVSEITYPFFEGYPVATFSSLAMRAGGQDVWRAYIRDSFFSRVGIQAGLDAANNRFAVLYINGKYWGLYDIREDISKNMLASKYDVDPDTVNYIRRNNPRAGTKVEYNRVRDFARTRNLKNDEVYKEFCQWVDVEAYADYLAAQNYFRNGDLFNQKIWFTNDYKIKIRPVYFDLDYSLMPGGLTAKFIENYFHFSGFTSKDGTLVRMDITAGLWENESFKELFIERYAYLMNTVFKPENLLPLFDEMRAEIEPEMAGQVDRWAYPASVSSWEQEIETLRQLLIDRPKYAKANLQKYFGLSDERMKELFPD